MNALNKFLSVGIAAIGISAIASPSAFATPTMTITVGNSSTNVALTNVSAAFGTGTYAAAAGSFDNFDYGGVLVTVSGSALQTQYGSVTDTSGTITPITFSSISRWVPFSTMIPAISSGSASNRSMVNTDWRSWNRTDNPNRPTRCSCCPKSSRVPWRNNN